MEKLVPVRSVTGSTFRAIGSAGTSTFPRSPAAFAAWRIRWVEV